MFAALKKISVALAVALGLAAGSAWAYTVKADGTGDAGTAVATSNNNGGGATGGEAEVLAAWNAANNPDFDVDDFLYKDNAGGSEEGSLAGNYTTAYVPTEGDATGATISWDGGSFFNCPTCLLIVKDGPHNPAVYLFSLAGWNGQDDLVLSGFWPNQGAISHVSIYGTPTTSTGGGPGSGTVPEPGSSSLALLGLALVAAGLRARGKKAPQA